MITGHFGLAAGVKKFAPRLPLWSLLLATFWLDIIFTIFSMFGLESFSPMDPANPAYGEVIINAHYTHSLVGALFYFSDYSMAGESALGEERRISYRRGRVLALDSGFTRSSPRFADPALESGEPAASGYWFMAISSPQRSDRTASCDCRDHFILDWCCKIKKRPAQARIDC